MVPSSDEARSALNDIDKIQLHVRRWGNYRDSSPYLILWGIVLASGNFAIQFMGETASMYWAVSGLCAVILTIYIGRVQSAQKLKNSFEKSKEWRTDNLRIGLTFGAMFVFMASACSILFPINLIDANALVTLFYASVFMTFGVWTGWRFCFIGVFMAVSVLINYHISNQYFFLWNGLIVGVGYLCGGIWLRRL